MTYLNKQPLVGLTWVYYYGSNTLSIKVHIYVKPDDIKVGIDASQANPVFINEKATVRIYQDNNSTEKTPTLPSKEIFLPAEYLPGSSLGNDKDKVKDHLAKLPLFWVNTFWRDSPNAIDAKTVNTSSQHSEIELDSN
jgi:hypothetical protein